MIQCIRNLTTGDQLMHPRIPLLSEDPQLLAALPALPTMDDLPSEDPEEPGLPDEFHDLQPQLLSRTLRLSGYASQELYTASDLNLYYDLSHPLWHKRPDWLLVVGVSRLYEGKRDRASYVIWQEKVSPAVIVELLSPGTESDDLGRFAPKPAVAEQTPPNTPPAKFQVYEQILSVPHYIVFNKRDSSLRYFRLRDGSYQEQAVAETNTRLWIPELGIGLAIWQGTFEGMPQAWLRWCDATGMLLPTDTEAALEREAEAQQQRDQAESQRQQAESQRDQAELQRQQAELQRQQAELQIRQTVLNLLAFGMEIEQVAQMTGLSVQEVNAIALK
jgi:Uma2 family endonuclease